MQKIAIGVSDFKTIRQDNYYYIDKTMYIKHILDKGGANEKKRKSKLEKIR